MPRLNPTTFIFYDGYHCSPKEFVRLFNEFRGILKKAGFVLEDPEGKFKYDSKKFVRVNQRNSLEEEVNRLSEEEKTESNILMMSLRGFLDMKDRFTLWYSFARPEQRIIFRINVDNYNVYSGAQERWYMKLVDIVSKALGRGPT